MILYTSDTNRPKRNRQIHKTIIVYLAVSLFCVIFDRIYALFGHGVFSASMTFMFLYPLLGGVLPFFLLWIFKLPEESDGCYRFCYNSYNSGIAALTVRSALNGVFEIAGTSSQYLILFTVFGWALLITGLLVFLQDLCISSRRNRRKYPPA